MNAGSDEADEGVRKARGKEAQRRRAHKRRARLVMARDGKGEEKRKVNGNE